MKKLLSLMLVMCMCFGLVLILASCDDHDHVFEEEWTSDSDYHWHACENANCDLYEDREEHDFEVKYDADGAPYNECKVCGKKNTKVNTAPEHEHEFAEDYTYSENFHWKACNVDGCFEAFEKEEHHYANPEVEYSDSSITMTYVCQICNYEKVETKEVESQLDNATEWNETFENFELTNFSMYVYIGGVDSEDTRHCMIDEDTVYYCIPGAWGREFYSQKNSDGTYTTYVKNQETGKFEIKEGTTGEWFVSASTEPVIRVSFADNFDKFTYDPETASYNCSEIIEAEYTNFQGTEWKTMYCYSSIIKVNDGKIAYVECEYNFDLENDEKASFIYYNIGMTDFSVPPQVIEEATK
ncbi:MAG: hypothetical protein J6Q78_01205 [Clostridia bacterium]|nr:hypothetical protein [Clostridia bacterium]